jgi:hypothetical protein
VSVYINDGEDQNTIFLPSTKTISISINHHYPGGGFARNIFVCSLEKTPFNPLHARFVAKRWHVAGANG